MQQMTDQICRLARMMSAWIQADAPPLQAIEAQVVRVLHDLGTTLLTALVPLGLDTFRGRADTPRA